MLDERLSKLRSGMHPAWDDLHESRVLGRVLEARRQQHSRGRFRRVAFATSGIAVAAGVAFAVLDRPSTTAPSATAAQPSQAATASALTFVEGSRALLSPGAKVHTDRQTEREVLLAQHAGTVRYEVHPDAQRVFQVRARGATIEVIGTIFTVQVESRSVHVSVDRGRVQVFDGERRVELGPGEQLSISSGAEPPAAAQAPASAAAPAGPTSERSPIQELLAKADAARRAGRLDEAAAALRQIANQHPADPRAVSALFTLGRVERARGAEDRAARAFHSAWSRAPSGPLAEDALAEEASSWAKVGNSSSAAAAAKRYMARYPQGSHADRMRRLVH
jgi:transmembrane sensor